MAEVVYDSAAIAHALDRMSEVMGATDGPVTMIGILRGGVRVADALERRLGSRGRSVERGQLDISFYRDDLDTVGPNPEVRPSSIPFDVTDRDIWLVDDVLYTGRTVRAALGEVFDYGRPARVRLAVLVDRGGRELPIAADLAGLVHSVDPGCALKLVADGPESEWCIETRRLRP